MNLGNFQIQSLTCLVFDFERLLALHARHCHLLVGFSFPDGSINDEITLSRVIKVGIRQSEDQNGTYHISPPPPGEPQ